MSAAPSPVALCLQPAVLEHKWIRTRDASHVFERPERIKAVILGAAAAVALLEGSASIDNQQDASPSTPQRETTPGSDVADLLGGLNISDPAPSSLWPEFSNGKLLSPYLFLPTPTGSASPTSNAASVSERLLYTHRPTQIAHSPANEHLPAVGAVGSTTPQSIYLQRLVQWALEAPAKIQSGECEIPSSFDIEQKTFDGSQMAPVVVNLNQNDLYLGPGTLDAIEGSIATVCQGVDLMCGNDSASSGSDAPRNLAGAFCAIRPPGHHCGEDTPSGFCFVNNVVIGAMHAYLKHKQERAIIFDFDLHHGNGTQSIVMDLNAASHAEHLLRSAGKPIPDNSKRPWSGFYGSLHDIWSFPCEDGDVDLIKDASVSIAAHGQYIENIHLEPYESEADFFDRLYPKYLAVLDKAQRFVTETACDPATTTVFISAGFDASEHEHQQMQRHDRRVPTTFFERLTRDIQAFAQRNANGKVISVLEGGYSDGALISGVSAHIGGLSDNRTGRACMTGDVLDGILPIGRRKKNGILAPRSADLRNDLFKQRVRTVLESLDGVLQTTNNGHNSDLTTTPRMILRDRKSVGDKHLDGLSPVHSSRSTGGKLPSKSTTEKSASRKSHTVKHAPSETLQISGPSLSATPGSARGEKMRGLPTDDDAVRLSKTIAYLLRHGAVKAGLPMRQDGHVRVSDLLEQQNLRDLGWGRLQDLVATNAKQRFVLTFGIDPSPSRPMRRQKGSTRPPHDPRSELPLLLRDPPDADSQQAAAPTLAEEHGIAEYFIRAAQGHSLTTVSTEHLVEIHNDAAGRAAVGEMVHGTRAELWDVIRENGLSRMSRQHIHLATARHGSKSGPRNNSTLFVYLSLDRLASSVTAIPVYKAANDVVLTPGNQSGIVTSDFFELVIRRRRVSESAESRATDLTALSGSGDIGPDNTAGQGQRSPSKQPEGEQYLEEIIWRHGHSVDPPLIL